MNSKTKKITIILLTIVLAGVAVFLGIKLYQMRQEQIAPTVPKAISEKCTLEFTVPAPSPTPTPSCYQTCDPENDTCSEGLVCQTVNNEPICVNPDCPEEEDCQCPGVTPTPTSTPTPTPETTPTPTSTPTPTPETTPTLTPTPTPTPETTSTPTPAPTTTPTTAPTETLIAETTLTPTTPLPTALPEAGSIIPTLGVILGGLILGILGVFFIF